MAATLTSPGFPPLALDSLSPSPALAAWFSALPAGARPDGIALSGTLYLPPGYKSTDGPLPTLLWAYPQEFKSADAAGQNQQIRR